MDKKKLKKKSLVWAIPDEHMTWNDGTEALPEATDEVHQAGPIGPAMDAKNDGGISPAILDLGKHRAGELDEGILGSMGAWIQDILMAMFGGPKPNLIIRGSRGEISSFIRATANEKRYIETAKKLGLDNPMTYKNKAKLDGAIRDFERKTGIPWPIKD